MKRCSLLSLVVIFVLIMMSCENDYPPSIWDPNTTMSEKPVVTQLIPNDSSYAGVGEVIIQGNHFSNKMEEILVYFNSNVAQLISASETEIKVKPPVLVGDSIKIRIAVQGSTLFSDPVYYRLKPAVAITGNLLENSQKAAAIALDNDGNIFVSIEGKVIKKIDAAGTVTHYADVSFLKASGMKMGPANTLYAVFAAGRVKKIATISPAGVEGTFVNLPGNPQDMDFDQNGNIWVNSGADLYLVKPDKSMLKIKTIPLEIKSIRVFNGYLYFSGMNDNTGEAKIWRCEIQGETLGAEELFLDLAAQAQLQGIKVNSFTFSQDGELFLATNGKPDAIFIYHPTSGSIDVFYPGLITADIIALTWSNGKFFYAVQLLEAGSNILKIDAQRPGAPYYGRQ